MSEIILLNMISLGLLFVLIVTGSWRKSYTTIAYVVSLVVGIEIMKFINIDLGILVIVAGAVFSVARAILQNQNDRFLKV